MRHVRDIVKMTVHNWAAYLPRGAWRHQELIVEDAVSRLKQPLPGNRLLITHLECAIGNAMEHYATVVMTAATPAQTEGGVPLTGEGNVRITSGPA